MSDASSTSSRSANVQTFRKQYAAGSPPTNDPIVAVSAGTIIVCVGITVAAHENNSVPVAVRVGFDLTATPTGADAFFGHPGIPHGAHIADRAGAGGMLGEGADGEDIFVTGDDPLNGSYDVIVAYYTRAV